MCGYVAVDDRYMNQPEKTCQQRKVLGLLSTTECVIEETGVED